MNLIVSQPFTVKKVWQFVMPVIKHESTNIKGYYIFKSSLVLREGRCGQYSQHRILNKSPSFVVLLWVLV